MQKTNKNSANMSMTTRNKRKEAFPEQSEVKRKKSKQKEIPTEQPLSSRSGSKQTKSKQPKLLSDCFKNVLEKEVLQGKIKLTAKEQRKLSQHSKRQAENSNGNRVIQNVDRTDESNSPGE